MSKKEKTQTNDEKKIFTVELAFKNINDNEFSDFFQIARKVQDEKIFLGKKHYEKILIISFFNEYVDLSIKYSINNLIQQQINQQLAILLEANDHNQVFGRIKKLTKIKVSNVKRVVDKESHIYMLLQSENNCDVNIMEELKRFLKSELCEQRKISRSSVYNSFHHPHTDVYQYPVSNRLLLNSFSYGIQKTLSSEYYKIWDLKELKDLYENPKDIYFIEFVHKINFKDEHEFFLFFTLKVLEYYISFKIQVHIDSIYTPILQSNDKNQSDDFTLMLKLIGFPKISKGFEINHNFYYHYDFLTWERYQNFLLGKIIEYGDLIKMQISQHHVIQLNINRKHMQENPETFKNIISYFKSQNKIQAYNKQDPKAGIKEFQFQKSSLYKVKDFLKGLNLKENFYQPKLKNALAKLIHSKIIDLDMIDNLKVQNMIIKNYKKVILLFKLMHLKPSKYNLNKQDLATFLESQCIQQNKLSDFAKEIKGCIWIPENFCLINKIVITPSVVIYGNEELIPLCQNFSKIKFYEQNAIIYFRDEDLKQFDFEETSYKYFNNCFEKYTRNDQVITEDLDKYNIEAVTSQGLQKNSFFASTEEQFYDSNSFLEYLNNGNINYTQPIYKCTLERLYIQGVHSDIGLINFSLLDKLLKGIGYDYNDNKFSSIFLNYKLNDSQNNLCTLFYIEDIFDQEHFIIFPESDNNYRIESNVQIQVFSVNKCKQEGYINQSNLGDLTQSGNLIEQSIQKDIIMEKKFQGLELSIQLNEVMIQQKINKLEFYKWNNTYPLECSYILTGRKAIRYSLIEKKYENIYDSTINISYKNFSIHQIQLKLPQCKQNISKVLIAKKKGTFVGKFYQFNVLEGSQQYQSNQKLNQSIILFHPNFQEYYFWPEFYSEKEDFFENNQREYVVITNPSFITEKIEEYTLSKIQEMSEYFEDQQKYKQKDQNSEETNILYQAEHRNDHKLGNQLLMGIVKTNIKPQAMLLFYGELIEPKEDTISFRNQRESYLKNLFQDLNLNQKQFDLELFKEEKKYYEFYSSLKSQLNHIIYSLNVAFQFGRNKQKNSKMQDEKNKMIQQLSENLYQLITHQIETLKKETKSQPNSYFQLLSYRNVEIEKDLVIPKLLLQKCIENMKQFYENINKFKRYYEHLSIDNEQLRNIMYSYHKNLGTKITSNVSHLDLSELVKLNKNIWVKAISQDFVDYFNKYFSDEISQERYKYLINEAKQSTKYRTNRAQILHKTQTKMKKKLLETLNEAMYVVNFYYIVQNKKLQDNLLDPFQQDLKELEQIAQEDLQDLVFYYCVYPKIIKSIEFDASTSQYYVKNKIIKQIQQENEENNDYELNENLDNLLNDKDNEEQNKLENEEISLTNFTSSQIEQDRNLGDSFMEPYQINKMNQSFSLLDNSIIQISKLKKY